MFEKENEKWLYLLLIILGLLAAGLLFLLGFIYAKIYYYGNL